MPKKGKNCNTTDEWKIWWVDRFLACLKAEKDFVLHKNNPQIVKIISHEVDGESYHWKIFGLGPDQIAEFSSVVKKNELTYLENSKYVEELEGLEYGAIENGGYEYWTPVIIDERGGGLLEELSLTPFVNKIKEISPFIEIIMRESSGEEINKGSFSVEASKSLQLTSPNLQILCEEFGCKISLEEKKLTVYFDDLDVESQQTIAFKTAIIIMSMM